MTRRTLSLGLGVVCALLIGSKTVYASTSSHLTAVCSDEITACVAGSLDCLDCLVSLGNIAVVAWKAHTDKLAGG